MSDTTPAASTTPAPAPVKTLEPDIAQKLAATKLTNIGLWAEIKSGLVPAGWLHASAAAMSKVKQFVFAHLKQIIAIVNTSGILGADKKALVISEFNSLIQTVVMPEIPGVLQPLFKSSLSEVESWIEGWLETEVADVNGTNPMPAVPTPAPPAKT